jgi:ribose 5-phosphate isomerase B
MGHPSPGYLPQGNVAQQATAPVSSSGQVPQKSNSNQALPGNTKKVIAIGSDHGGYELKEVLKTELSGCGYEIADMGTHSKDACDYPDFAKAVAMQVSSGKAWRGVMIDGAGIGSCMVGNKVHGVRAAMAYDHASAVNSREHNDANMLTLGAGMIGVNLAKQILKTWLESGFSGGRHSPRVDKIMAVEQHQQKQGN